MKFSSLSIILVAVATLSVASLAQAGRPSRVIIVVPPPAVEVAITTNPR